MFLII
jgi:hypothetical protein